MATETSWWYFRAGTQETYIWISYPRPRASGIWYLCGKDLRSCCAVIHLWQKAPYQLACETLLALGEKSSFGLFACFVLKRGSFAAIIPDTAVRSYCCSAKDCCSRAFLCNRTVFPREVNCFCYVKSSKESSYGKGVQLGGATPVVTTELAARGWGSGCPSSPTPSGLGHAWWRQQNYLVFLMSTFPAELQQLSSWSLENPQGVWGLWHTSSLEPQSCCGPRTWVAVVPTRNLLWSQAVADVTPPPTTTVLAAAGSFLLSVRMPSYCTPLSPSPPAPINTAAK